MDATSARVQQMELRAAREQAGPAVIHLTSAPVRIGECGRAFVGVPSSAVRRRARDRLRLHDRES